MFCNKDTADGKKTLKLRQPATKNYTKRDNHVKIQNIKLGESEPTQKAKYQITQTELQSTFNQLFKSTSSSLTHTIRSFDYTGYRQQYNQSYG